MPKPRSDRIQKYKANRIAGMNRKNAAIAAGYSVSYALTHANKLEEAIAKDLRDAFERQGLTDKKIVQYAMEGLFAMKLQACDIHVHTEDGKVKINKNSNDFIEVPDWHARHKFFNSINELCGRIKTQVEHSGKVEGVETRIVIVYPEGWKPKEERLGSKTQSISGRLPA